ncbi:MAG: EamA family transporter [Armatimonadetes bacterium]|nr:EamA family transporter [Armatimonadota bacterium]
MALVTAAAFAASGSYAKALSRKTHIFVITWAFIALSAPWSAMVLLREGMPPIGDEFLKAALISVAVNMIGTTLSIKALTLSPLSLTVPFLSFTPLFMLIPSWFVLKETPNASGLAGILLIVMGGYAMHVNKIRGGGVLAPFRAVASEKGSMLMLLVAAIWSISAVYDKVASVASSSAYYTTFFSVTFGFVYAPFLIVGLRREPVSRAVLPRLFVLGLLTAVMILSQFAAIQLTVASYVIAIKRAGMLLSVVLGYFFFGERHLRERLSGAVLMTLGVILLSFQGS